MERLSGPGKERLSILAIVKAQLARVGAHITGQDLAEPAPPHQEPVTVARKDEGVCASKLVGGEVACECVPFCPASVEAPVVQLHNYVADRIVSGNAESIADRA